MFSQLTSGSMVEKVRLPRSSLLPALLGALRDHIIRSLSNSARCTLETPCLDCQRILIHFPDGVKQHLCKPQKKPAGPAGARRQQKKAAAAAAAVTPAASLSATTAATDAATS